jgi:hypothetical protein
MKHDEFVIGHLFSNATGIWRCTDVGTRTITAMRIKGDGVPEGDIWFEGPPYMVAEISFNEDEMPNCQAEANVS